MKNKVPLALMKSTGLELSTPGRMSFTSTVPADVPSLFHGSRPLVGSLAVKYSVPPALTKS